MGDVYVTLTYLLVVQDQSELCSMWNQCWVHEGWYGIIPKTCIAEFVVYLVAKSLHFHKQLTHILCLLVLDILWSRSAVGLKVQCLLQWARKLF